MMQRVLLVLLILCPLLATAGDTVLKLYRPFGEVIEQVPPTVKRSLSGQCFTQSALILRDDAWRCQAQGRVYDPCFVKPVGTRKEAVCPQSPWMAESVQIVVDTPLNNDQNTALDMSRAYPWAIELSNGDHCQAVDPNEVYEGMPVRYRCSDHNLLVGHLQRCKSVWSMLEKTPSGIETVSLSKVWF